MNAKIKAAPRPPKRIHLETRRFVIRGMSVTDLTDTWDAWGADEEAMRMYNQRPLKDGARDGFARSILAANGQTVFTPGVFTKSGEPLGFFTIKLDPGTQVASFEYFIGNRDWWGKDAVLEARAALLTYMFEERGIAKAVGYPFSRNFSSIFNYLAQGWVQEGILKSHVPAADGSGRLDQHIFRLLRDEWAAATRQKAN